MLAEARMTYTRLYHYTHSEDIARTIARSGVLIPNAPPAPAGIGCPDGYCSPRVNVTSIPPERGIEAIQTGTGMVVKPAFGLETLMDTTHELTQLFPELYPDSYHLLTDEPVPVKVTRIWNVERAARRAQSGWRFRRFGEHLGYLSIALSPGNL